jgi:hypothetical protein
MENITTEVVEKEDQPEQKLQTAIKDISIDNENVALNVLVGMINIAQKRGAFNLEESAKAWECIQMFTKSPTSQ